MGWQKPTSTNALPTYALSIYTNQTMNDEEWNNGRHKGMTDSFLIARHSSGMSWRQLLSRVDTAVAAQAPAVAVIGNRKYKTV
jgi:hypothetical protein